MSCEPKIISRLKMDGTLDDEIGSNHGKGYNIQFSKGVDGTEKGSVLLNGRDSYVEIPDNESLHFGKGDFFMGLWVKIPDKIMCYGDLICKFDDKARKGFNLTMNGTSGGYTGISDTHNIYFGIDDKHTGEWTDCGKPSSTNTLISTMCVYEGELYAGISDAVKRDEACRVFKYCDNGKWIDCGRLGNDPDSHSVHSMLVHNGKLYASTSIWDWGAAQNGRSSIGHIYCYEGGTGWRDCGQVGTGYRVMGMASHKGELYVGNDNSEIFRYIDDNRWEFCGGDRGPKSNDSMDIFRMDTLLSTGDELFGGGRRRIFKYEGGTEWECIFHKVMGTTQVHKLQMYKGNLIAGTWPYGKVLRFSSDLREISDMGQLGISTDKYKINEVNDLVLYNGKLYAGVIPKAEVYRYDEDNNWCMLKSFVDNPGYNPEDVATWNRVPSMAVYKGKLYVSASTSHGWASLKPNRDTGRVFSIECGKNVSHDTDIGTGWHHIAVAKEDNMLSMYIDGKKTDMSDTFDKDRFNIDNNEPLKIGFGYLKHLNAAIDDVIIGKGKFSLLKEPLHYWKDIR